ncbi:hypothetical protein BK748_14220 [Bacillus thuringiensis serovar graciosensis]|nr:hypothetical protein BK748_14220 [Bacillus thuringiensis serovar graciosensis]
MKSFLSHLKTEKLYLVHSTTYEMAYQTIQEYIQFYNKQKSREKLPGFFPME